MSRLLTLLLLYKNGYSVGKYISIERQIEKTKDRYIAGNGDTSNAYDIVKKYTEEKVGKFTGAEVVAHCPSIGISSVLASLRKLVDEGSIIRYGSGRCWIVRRGDKQLQIKKGLPQSLKGYDSNGYSLFLCGNYRMK